MDISVGTLTLHLQERPGDGALVLLLHGWATSSMVWQPVLDRWQGSERLLALDLRGAGFSDKPQTGYTLEQHAQDVAAVLAALAQPVVLVGHSFGGMIAQRVALDQPQAVRRLVLVSPVPASGAPLSNDERVHFRSLAGRRAGMNMVLSSMMAKGPSGGIEALLAAAASVSAGAYLEGLDAFCDTDFAHRLGELSLPTHVLGGELEQPLSPAVLRAAVVDRIRGATFEAIEGVGHYAQWEAPDVFTRALSRAARG
jgi:non-heme chloroperoxidase